MCLIIYFVSKSDQKFSISMNKLENLSSKSNADILQNTKEFLQNFMANFNTNFAITFHFENKSEEIIDSIFKNLNSSKLICGAYNYDNFDETFLSNKKNHCVTISAHVVLLNNPKLINFTLKKDVLILVPHEKDKIQNYNDLIEEKLLKKIFAVFYIDVQSNTTTLFDICFYCGNRSKKLTKLADTDHDYPKLLSKIERSINRRNRDFNGHIFKFNMESYEKNYTQLKLPNGISLIESSLVKYTRSRLMVYRKGINTEFQGLIGYNRRSGKPTTYDNMDDLKNGLADFVTASVFYVTDEFSFVESDSYDHTRGIYVANHHIMNSGILLIESHFLWFSK